MANKYEGGVPLEEDMDEDADTLDIPEGEIDNKTTEPGKPPDLEESVKRDAEENARRRGEEDRQRREGITEAQKRITEIQDTPEEASPERRAFDQTFRDYLAINRDIEDAAGEAGFRNSREIPPRKLKKLPELRTLMEQRDARKKQLREDPLLPEVLKALPEEAAELDARRRKLSVQQGQEVGKLRDFIIYQMKAAGREVVESSSEELKKLLEQSLEVDGPKEIAEVTIEDPANVVTHLNALLVSDRAEKDVIRKELQRARPRVSPSSEEEGPTEHEKIQARLSTLQFREKTIEALKGNKRFLDAVIHLASLRATQAELLARTKTINDQEVPQLQAIAAEKLKRGFLQDLQEWWKKIRG